MSTVNNTSQQVKFFFNDDAVEYGVAHLLARAAVELAGDAKPALITETTLACAMKALGKITTGHDGSREISQRAMERITRWNRRTIAKALELLEASELITKLADTNLYSAGPAVADGRLRAEIDHFNACISRREKPTWPINNDKRRGARKRAAQERTSQFTTQVVQSEYTTPEVQVVHSEYTTPDAQVVQSEYTTQVVQSEYTTLVQSECTTLRGIETKPPETFLNPETGIPAGSDLARLLEGEASTAERSPRSHGPSARAHLERSQPSSAPPEQPDQQIGVDGLIRQAAAGQRKRAQPEQPEQSELTTDYNLHAEDDRLFLLNPKPGMLLMYEYVDGPVRIESIEDGLVWVRCTKHEQETLPLVDGAVELSGSGFRPLTKSEASSYNAKTSDVVETYEQCEAIERV